MPGDRIQAFNDHGSRHALSVREFRSFWRCFVGRMPELDWCGSIEPVCVSDQCETTTLRSLRFFHRFADVGFWVSMRRDPCGSAELDSLAQKSMAITQQRVDVVQLATG